MVGHCRFARFAGDGVEVRFLQALAQRHGVAHGGQAAPHGTLAHHHQQVAHLAEFPQRFDVLGVGTAALHKPEVTTLREGFDVGERRFVERHEFGHVEYFRVNIQHRHVAPKTAGQRHGGDGFLFEVGYPGFIEYLVGVVLLGGLQIKGAVSKWFCKTFAPHNNGTCGTNRHRLFGIAIAQARFLLIVDAHLRFVAAVHIVEHPLAVSCEHLFHAPFAFDAAVVLQHHPPGPIVDQAILKQVRKTRLGNSKFIAHVLQIAVAAFFAGRTKMVAFGKHHLHQRFAHVEQFRSIYFHLQSLFHRFGAGRVIAAVDFTGARAAGAEWRIDMRKVTERRYEDAMCLGGIDQVRSFLCLVGFSIHPKCAGCHGCYGLKRS